MSIQAINQYHNAVHEIYLYSGKNHEQVIKDEFKKLLNHYAKKRHLLVVSEIHITNKKSDLIRPDGLLKNNLQHNCGYWESKANVDLEKEIIKKINAGYSLINTLFQDDKTAILYREGKRILTALLTNEDELDKLLTEFVSYESKETKEFYAAVEKFKNDLPRVLTILRDMIIEQEKINADFVKTRTDFLKICQLSINKDVTLVDVNEMLLQHILTEEIFTSIFDNSQFHQENNIAKKLYDVESTFFKKETKRNTLIEIKVYYEVIKATAVNIADYHDKQVFLKRIYEDFYKAYNPKAADRMGIIYTPHACVKFQIESVDYLLEKHFKKSLAAEGIKILDPCTGTGTYICDLIDYLPAHRLTHKYKHDIFANELGLLPYYIAYLNIEYTYQQKMQNYVEFEHLCWTDTLDNTGFNLKGTTMDLFGLSIENTTRIKKQNEQKISVIIGNPPYNANQQNENDNNKNREYYQDSKKKTGGIDGRIKDTYIAHSNAQKTKVYDMYSRFYRWASDRLDEEQGIIAFITNNSFIDSRTFDGFRKCIGWEFDFAYIIDFGGDLRKNTDSNDNVFGITLGVAILILVKKDDKKLRKCEINYYRLPNCESKEEKLELLRSKRFDDLPFDKIIPDKNNNWINQTENDFDSFLPVCDKQVKSGKSQNAIFSLFSNGVSTNRDEWVYDFSREKLVKKMQFFFKEYNNEVTRWKKWKKENSYTDIKAESNPVVDNFLHERNIIKWSKMLKRDKLRKHKKGIFDKNDIKNCLYRPFLKNYLYNGYIPIDIKGEFNKILFDENKFIVFNNGSLLPFNSIAVNSIVDLHFNGDSVCLPLYTHDVDDNKNDNITDWALTQFKNQYPTLETLSKLDIFHYAYAILHNPDYRAKYEQNLKREFPRIPFYENFMQWADYGKQLMELHLNYEMAEHYPLKRQNLKVSKIPKAKLKADKEQGLIYIDDNTTLSEIPPAAWEYKLGNRSALEWILDQYKEKKPTDNTITEKFNTYRFADYKEQVIELLKRVCTVSVETVRIVELLRTESNSPNK
jgi:predicted helicase